MEKAEIVQEIIGGRKMFGIRIISEEKYQENLHVIENQFNIMEKLRSEIKTLDKLGYDLKSAFDKLMRERDTLEQKYEDLKNKYIALTDRDEFGRFVKKNEKAVETTKVISAYHPPGSMNNPIPKEVYMSDACCCESCNESRSQE